MSDERITSLGELGAAWARRHEHQAEEIYNAAVRLVDHMRMRRR